MTETGARRPNRKSQIMVEATRLFGSNGYSKVSTKMLADACGITEPALYRHFDSKEAIYSAVLTSIGNRLECEALFAQLAREDDIEVILREMALHIISFAKENQDIYRLLLFSALGGHAQAKRVHQTIRGTFKDFLLAQLDRLYQDGLITKKNNEITARCFVGMVFDCALSVTLWRGFQGKEFQPDEVVANNVPIYARGLRSD